MTDWNTIGLPFLYAFEDTLSCPICREILVRAPKITDCGHTFCSECITRYLTQQGDCPVCRSKTQRGTLRNNKNVEDIAEKWVTETKPKLIAHLEGAVVGAGADGAGADGAGADGAGADGAGAVEAGAVGAGANGARAGAIESQPDLTNPNKTNSNETKPVPELPTHGTCPVCHKSMPLQLLQTTHIEKCLQSPPRPRAPRSTSIFGQEFPQTKLSLPTLDAMTETKLRNRLKELGLSFKGNKPRLKARFTEWVTIYNAAIDDRHPPTVQELRKRMVQWDRAQEHGSSSLKTLDAQQWTKEHREEYDELVEQAQRKRQRRN